MKKHIFSWLFLSVLLLGGLSCQNSITQHPVTICIQPLGAFNQEYIDSIVSGIQKVYLANVIVADPEEMPASAFTNIKVPRYRADSLLRYLKVLRPADADYILGYTEKDISTTKRNRDGTVKTPVDKYEDWGIFGLGYRPGPASIVSSRRLETSDRNLFFDRLQKVAVHELGHNMSLAHCFSENCVMADAAEKISTVDRVDLQLCYKCVSALRGKFFWSLQNQ